MTSSLGSFWSGQSKVNKCSVCRCTWHRTSTVLGVVPVVTVIIVTQYDCFLYHCYITNSANLVAKKQLFYCAHGVCGSDIQKGHSRDGLSLFLDIWNIDWEGSKSGVFWWLGLESSEGSFTHILVTGLGGTWRLGLPTRGPTHSLSMWLLYMWSLGSWTSNMAPSSLQSEYPKKTKWELNCLFWPGLRSWLHSLDCTQVSKVGCLFKGKAFLDGKSVKECVHLI